MQPCSWALSSQTVVKSAPFVLTSRVRRIARHLQGGAVLYKQAFWALSIWESTVIRRGLVHILLPVLAPGLKKGCTALAGDKTTHSGVHRGGHRGAHRSKVLLKPTKVLSPRRQLCNQGRCTAAAANTPSGVQQEDHKGALSSLLSKNTTEHLLQTRRPGTAAQGCMSGPWLDVQACSEELDCWEHWPQICEPPTCCMNT